MLEVESKILDKKGAVSEAVAKQMVKSVIDLSNADVAVSITGIAGPTGGTKEKPVGTVCFGFIVNHSLTTCTQSFQGERSEVIDQSVRFAVDQLIALL